MAYTTFLFDLDGTLIDSVELIVQSYRHTLKHLGREPLPDRHFISLMGIPLVDAMRTLAASKAEVEQMVSLYREFNLAHHDAMVRPYPGVKETLLKLKARQCRLAVVTSKLSADARRGLTIARLINLFDTVVGADDVSRGKPDPEAVREGLMRLGSAAEQAVMVGDSPPDLRAGRSAGVRTAAALWGPFERAQLAPEAPDHWLPSFRDVADL